MASANNNVSSSGITIDTQTGERYIPSSVRADGTKRREIRVRPGYKPPEDVELYKNRAAAAWKTRSKGGVPGAEVSSEDDQAAHAGNSASSNKNAKRREARRKAKEAQTSSDKKGVEPENWRSPAGEKEEQQPTETPVDAEAEKEKKARNLKKKLRQARDLRDKKNQGESLLPEQLEKVIKIQELIRQLDALGFDANGDKKDSSDGKGNV